MELATINIIQNEDGTISIFGRKYVTEDYCIEMNRRSYYHGIDKGREEMKTLNDMKWE